MRGRGRVASCNIVAGSEHLEGKERYLKALTEKPDAFRVTGHVNETRIKIELFLSGLEAL